MHIPQIVSDLTAIDERFFDGSGENEGSSGNYDELVQHDSASRPLDISVECIQPTQFGGIPSAALLFSSNFSTELSPPSQSQVADSQAVATEDQSTIDCGGLTTFLGPLSDPTAAELDDSVDALAWATDDAFHLDRFPTTTGTADASLIFDSASSCRRLLSRAWDPGCDIAVVSWRRPHGRTAITPGLKRIKLRVRLAKSSSPRCTHDSCEHQNSPGGSSGRSNEDSSTTSSTDARRRAIQNRMDGFVDGGSGHGSSPGDAAHMFDMHNKQQGGNASHYCCDPAADPKLFCDDGSIKADVISHLLSLFKQHLSSLFPFLDVDLLTKQLDTSVGPSFLLNSIAAVSARFSDHPFIALPHLQPSEFGNVFSAQAKSMLGSMLTVPSRATVAALALLALVGAGNDSESEVWMLMGMATRMSQDLGLHLDSANDAQMKSQTCRNDRLLFWSIFLLDCALSFGVGRSVTFNINSITQLLPSDEDMKTDPNHPISPFPYICRIFSRFAPVINALNENTELPTQQEADVDSSVMNLMDSLVSEYTQLPQTLEISANNMRSHMQAGNSTAYIWLHMWFHAILASMDSRSQASTGTWTQRGRDSMPISVQQTRQHDLPNTDLAAWLWPEDGARSVHELVSLADMTEFPAYCSIPLLNQPLFISASFFVAQVESSTQVHHPLSMNEFSSNIPPSQSTSDRWAIQKHKRTISTLKDALKNQSKYWSGIGWILGSLEQRIQGSMATEVDLEKITEQSPNSITLPDPGLLRSMAESSEIGITDG